MKPSNTAGSTGKLFRILIVAGAALTTCVLIAMAILIWNLKKALEGPATAAEGPMTAHYRPRGQGDVTFGIAPQGDALVFNANGMGGRDLYLLDLKTLGVSRIAATPDYEVAPELSPDGKSVVYAAGKPGDRADHIFVRSIDGKTKKQLTAEDANDEAPAFSPDGPLIAFTRCKTYNWGGLAANWGAGALWVMKADGTDIRQITEDGSIAIDPRFSPDGKDILFWNVDGLFTVPVRGSRPPTPLGNLRGRSAVYSFDDRSIAFSNGRYAHDSRIFLANVDGTSIKQLAYPGDSQPALRGDGCFRPAFAPDGKRVLFFFEIWPERGTGNSKERLWEVDIELGNPREIAGYGLFDDPLNWRPGLRTVLP